MPSIARPFAVCFTLIFLLPLESSVLAQRAYWTDQAPGTHWISHADLVEPGMEIFLDRSLANSLAMDPDTNTIYWAEFCSIYRAHLDGSGVELGFTLDEEEGAIAYLSGIALDTLARKVYWGSPESSFIWRANLDGSKREDVLCVAPSTAHALALDLTNGKVYWSQDFTRIRRANLDGTMIETIVPGVPDDAVLQIAVDASGSKIYWAEGTSNGLGGSGLYRANLDGSSVEPIVDFRAVGLALDEPGGKLFWITEHGINRANLDGTDPELVVPAEADPPCGLPCAAGRGFAIDLRRPGDCTEDRRTDLSDHSSFVACLTGPGIEFEMACSCADSTRNGFVALDDFAVFQADFQAP